MLVHVGDLATDGEFHRIKLIPGNFPGEPSYGASECFTERHTMPILVIYNGIVFLYIQTDTLGLYGQTVKPIYEISGHPNNLNHQSSNI